MNNELVSIVIPVYNGEKYIEACINSVINQTYQNLEILIIDDGSTDNTKIIIKKMVEMDNRINYVFKENGGVSSSRNLGIREASGKYIVFIDSDDFIEKEYIEKMINNNTNYDFVMSGYKTFYNDNNYSLYECIPFDGKIDEFCESIFRYIKPPLLLGPCFKMFKLNIIKRRNIFFPEDISFGEDAEFVFSYLKYTRNVKCINYIGYVYRKDNNDSLSSKFMKDKMTIYYRLVNDLKELLIFHNSLVNNNELINSMLYDNFISYSHELFNSELKYSEKKAIFFQESDKYEILNKYNKTDKNRFASKLIYFSCKYKIFIFTFTLFKIHDIRRSIK